MNKLVVPIVFSNPLARLPIRKTVGSAGFDLFLPETVKFKTGEIRKINMGFRMHIPEGWHASIRPRSSSGLLFQIVGSPSTIDSDYRGDLFVPIRNTMGVPMTLASGDRVAQMVFLQTPEVEWAFVETLDSTDRGEGGFGSTGR